MCRVLKYVQNGWPQNVSPQLAKYKKVAEELTCVNGCLQRGLRTVIHTELRSKLLQELHVSHAGMVRMKSMARGHIWWPGIDTDIEQLVRDCHPCQMHRHQPEPVPAASWPKAKGPWERIHADLAGLLEGVMYLVVSGTYSKWLEVVPMSTTTSAGTIRVLRRTFAAHGYPAAFVSDNGPQFVSAEFESFLAKNIVHLTSAPYYAPTNGLAERAVQTFKEAF